MRKLVLAMNTTYREVHAWPQSMARLGLIDEYRFFVHPVVSPGATWFARLEDGLGLELISAAAYRDGVVAAYDRPRNT